MDKVSIDKGVQDWVLASHRGLEEEPLRGGDALAKHSVGGGSTIPIGGQGIAGVTDSLAAVGAACASAAAGATKDAAAAVTGSGGSGGRVETSGGGPPGLRGS